MKNLRMRRARAATAILVVVACALFAASAEAKPAAAPADVGWGAFGNTPDELRHSPLTQVDPGNVAQLQRRFSVDFLSIDPNVRKGEQSYPVVSGNTMYMTTNDDNVWALDATTGKVKWRWTPDNVAVFRNFGIVANRGVALCDGHVFVLTLDMTIAQLNPANGRLQRRVAIATAVPGATVDDGYSETSAPICADHRLILGAAGSEFGVRGFVMAYNTSDLSPAWPNPFWTIPPAGTEWRRFSTLAGGGVVWTPTTVDTTTHTLYFGTGSATPLYFPSIRPGSDPRADSLIAVDLVTGRMKWWQQQMAFNEWSYDTAQPALVYDAKVGGKTERIVSVATMEGVWFAYDAATGRPIYQRVKVINRTEHPNLIPGKAVAVFPSSIGGLNYSPASYDPHTDYVLEAAAETAAVDVQTKLTPTEKKRKFTKGDVFLGLMNGDFGAVLPGFHDSGSISAIDVSSGKQVWKLTTPEPERGGVTTTDSGLGFAGGGDGVLRAFDVKTGKVLWTFQTGHPIAAGPSIYSVGGTEYVAITVGGTPTSSNGGTATQLQVFALGHANATSTARTLQTVAERTHRAAPQGSGRIVTQGGLVVRPWEAGSSNVERVAGRVLWDDAPVAGAQVVVDDYAVPQVTAKDGSFGYDADITVPLRHVVRIGSLRGATVRGKPLTHPRPARCTAKRLRRVQRGIRSSRVERARAEGRERRRHRSRHEQRQQWAAGGAPADVSSRRHDHRCVGQAGPGCRRDHAHAGPRLLDTLLRERRAGPLHVVLRGLGRDGRRPGVDQRRSCPRCSLVRGQRRHQRLVCATEERDGEHPARLRYELYGPGSGLDRGGRVLGARPRCPHRQPRGEAARRALAGRRRRVLVHTPAVGAWTDAHAVGERAPVVLPHAAASRRPGRPQLLAVAARRRRPGRTGDAEDPAAVKRSKRALQRTTKTPRIPGSLRSAGRRSRYCTLAR
jgi:alcohol dehydrogenase (cytochrome c)